MRPEGSAYVCASMRRKGEHTLSDGGVALRSRVDDFSDTTAILPTALTDGDDDISAGCSLRSVGWQFCDGDKTL